MRRIKSGILIWFTMAFLAVTWHWAGTVQARTKADETVSSSYGEKLDSYFRQAQKDLRKQEDTKAASQILKGASVLREAAKQAKGKVQKSLVTSADELESLAKGLEKEAAYTRDEVEKTFSRAHHAMAEYYDFGASDSFGKNAISQVAEDLRAGADHLERAWAWLGNKKEAGTQTAIEHARQLSDRLKQGSEWVAEEVSKGIDEIHRAVLKLDGANKTESEGPLKIVPIRSPEMVDMDQRVAGAIMRVARAAIPSVVQIRVTESREVPNPFLPYEGNPNFRKYFGLPKKMPKKFKEELKGLGTGMIVTPEGYILTNNHVVGGATEIKVLLYDGEEYGAKVVGTDPKTDLGVIKINVNKPLPCVTFADSGKVQVGQWVVAIGHPRGLEQSVTQGIISGKHRTGISNPSGYQDFLQTGASINPGNSGGPLLTLQGMVIGVNSAIATQSGGFEGLGFAIPSNMAVQVANALMAHGKVERGWLGVSVQDVTSDLAKSFGLPVPTGALIADVMKGGPGEKADLKRGDVVLEYRGNEIGDAAELRNRVAETPRKEEVRLTVWRDKKRLELRARIGSLEELTERLASPVKKRLGVVVGPVTADQAANYGLRAPEGVSIHWVDSDGPLGKVGFEEGDLILAIGKSPIDGVDTFFNIVDNLPQNQKVVLLALDHRSGKTSYVQVEIP